MYIAISSLLGDEMDRPWKFMREGWNYVDTDIFFFCLFYTHTIAQIHTAIGRSENKIPDFEIYGLYYVEDQ